MDFKKNPVTNGATKIYPYRYMMAQSVEIYSGLFLCPK